MKKLLALGLLTVAAFGTGSAIAAECAGPVALDCTKTDDEGNESFCSVYVGTTGMGTPVDGSFCGELDQ